MLAIARKQAIRERLQEYKSVQITDLAAALNVTKETIRRDLRDMEQDGELIRTHGGAYILDGVQNDIDISTRQVLKMPEKEIIAQKCDSLIQSGDYLYLDGSTTAWTIARTISHRRLTVLTPSLEIANILSASDTVRLFVVGGEFSAVSRSFTGNSAVRNLEQYFVDKAIISCRSVSMEFGLTDTNDNDAILHRLALEHAREKYLAIDYSKLDKTSFSRILPVSALDGIIMDRSFPVSWIKYLGENQVHIY
ncbi:MAG: DeoR/GlpR family DNA-binding transcription regulator [Lachnospiraceae bacterium]|nr:DeoR/GlpR family DNA-binding transcription regulator [Lachnospiraceae bacterium]